MADFPISFDFVKHLQCKLKNISQVNNFSIVCVHNV